MKTRRWLSQYFASESIKVLNPSQVNAATRITAFARGYLVRRLMKTRHVQDLIRNVKETLQLVLNLSDRDTGNPVQNIVLKAKLFRQLQQDLYSFNSVFTNLSRKDQMEIIATDRESLRKKQAEENQMNLSLSFRDVVWSNLSWSERNCHISEVDMCGLKISNQLHNFYTIWSFSNKRTYFNKENSVAISFDMTERTPEMTHFCGVVGGEGKDSSSKAVKKFAIQRLQISWDTYYISNS